MKNFILHRLNRIILFLLFFLNVSISFEDGSIKFLFCQKANAQFENEDGQWLGADGMTDAEWMAATSPSPYSINNYVNNLSPGDYISQTFYNDHLGGTNSSQNVSQWDYYLNSGYIDPTSGELIETHSEYQYTFYVLDEPIFAGEDEIMDQGGVMYDGYSMYYLPAGYSVPVYVPQHDEIEIGSPEAAREEELTKAAKEDPHRFIKDIPCSEIEKWKSLANKTTGGVNMKIEALNNQHNLWTDFEIQEIKNARGTTINMDYFPVTISQLPPGMSASQILQTIRLNINDFIDPTLAEFTPYSEDEASAWNDYGYSAIIHIDMGNNSTWAGGFYPSQIDDGSVICISSRPDHWTFATIQAPGDFEHPVSGNRMFGYVMNDDGSYTFFTRGVDRATGWIDNLASGIGFEMADALWASFQEGIKDYVISHGGYANIETPLRGRPEWEDIKAYFENRKSIDQLGCKE